MYSKLNCRFMTFRSIHRQMGMLNPIPLPMYLRFTPIVLLLWLTPVLSNGQALPVSHFQSMAIGTAKTGTETITDIGRQFLGSPYAPHTLDIYANEQLVVNFRSFDCTTYLETVLALSLAGNDVANRQNQAVLEQTFRKYLTKLRYRDGQISGYGSRLHYFSDWLRDNERQGLIREVTSELTGSMTVSKPLSYMTTTTKKFPQLRNPALYRQMTQIETSLSKQAFSFIPGNRIAEVEAQLQDGDIIMLMAARPGLDMRHVGLAVRQPNGRIHLLHASSEAGKVTITPYPLSNYVLWHKQLSGIRVARIRSGNVLEAAYAPGH